MVKTPKRFAIVRARRTWGALKPVTRVKQSKRVYSRKRPEPYEPRFQDDTGGTHKF